MNLTALIRMKEKIAISGDFTPKERDFLLEAVNAVVEHEREIGKLQNPNAVHANMLRGSIAKPSWEQIKHLYPEQFAAEPQTVPRPEVK